MPFGSIEAVVAAVQEDANGEVENIERDLAAAIARARDEDRRLDPQLEEQRLRQRQLAAEGEVVTAETLRLARERRDDGWTRVRKGYVDCTDDATELGRAFDADRLLPDAFEAAQEEADRQADLLRADARRAAIAAECSTRVEQMEARRREIAAVLTSLGARRESVLAEWTARLTQAQLPALDADALREWQARRDVVLDLADRLAGLRSDRNGVLAEASTAASTLVVTLRAAGQTIAEVQVAGEVDALPSLIGQALQWERKAAENEAQRGAQANGRRTSPT